MNNKEKIAIIVLIFIISSTISGYLYFDEPAPTDWPPPELEPPMFWLYNGTRFFVNDVATFNLEEKDSSTFLLTFGITFQAYNDTIEVIVADSEYSYPIHPINPNDEDGSYLIENLQITIDNAGYQYPFEEYRGNITFVEAVDSGGFLSLNFIEENYSSSYWKSDFIGRNRELHFRFYRIQDQNVFRTLKLIGFLTFNINLLALLIITFLIDKTKSFSHWSYTGSFLFYSGVVVGVPFYFGVIFNYYTFYAIYGANSIYILGLMLLMIFSIILGSLSFASRDYKKRPK